MHLTLDQGSVGSNPTSSANYNGEEIWPAPNRVLKTCGTRDGMGIDTSPHRQNAVVE